jgi:hypothetical protein
MTRLNARLAHQPQHVHDTASPGCERRRLAGGGSVLALATIPPGLKSASLLRLVCLRRGKSCLGHGHKTVVLRVRNRPVAASEFAGLFNRRREICRRRGLLGLRRLHRRPQ